MEKSARTIYWREDIQSYLPKFNSLLVENFFRMEMTVFLSGMESGKILEYTEFSKRFGFYSNPDNPKERRWHLKPESKNFQTDSAFLGSVSSKTSELFGKWTESFYLWNYYCDSKVKWNSLDRLDEVVKFLCDELRKIYVNTDNPFKSIHAKLQELNLKTPDAIVRLASEEIVRYKIENMGIEESWYWEIPALTLLFLESAGYSMNEKHLDTCCGRYFSSYVVPEEDVIQKYLDDVNAVAIQHLFDEKYGE